MRITTKITKATKESVADAEAILSSFDLDRTGGELRKFRQAQANFVFFVFFVVATQVSFLQIASVSAERTHSQCDSNSLEIAAAIASASSSG